MFVRRTIFVLALAGASVSTAFANDGNIWPSGELQDARPHAVQSGKTRIAVQQELRASGSNRVAADGVQVVNGEIGYVSPSHAFAFEGGKLVHADRIAHDTPKPSLAMSPAERRMYDQQYGGN